MARPAGPQGKAWCFTIPNPTPEDEEQLRQLAQLPQVKRIVAGFEIGQQNGLEHYQGFVQFHQRLRRHQVIQLMGGQVHVEQAKGGHQSNYEYCAKGGDVRFVKGYIDRIPAEKRKMDWREMMQDAKVMNPEEFEEKWPRIWFLHSNFVERIMIEAANKKALPWDGELHHKNIWIWGKAGIGKSRWAMQQAPLYETLKKNCNKWWCGYETMRTTAVIIEDWPARPYGDCLVQHLKIWGNRHPLIGETKGSALMVEPRRFFVIITSDFPMEQCFSREEDIEALKRRFRVMEMTEENRVLIETMRLDQELLAE
jgi:hypothetical protein